MSGDVRPTQEAQIFFSTRLDVVVVGSLLSGMSMTVVMPPAAAAFVAVSMPVPQEALLLLYAEWAEPSEGFCSAGPRQSPACSLAASERLAHLARQFPLRLTSRPVNQSPWFTAGSGITLL